MAHAGGRPPKYKTVEELQAVIDEYFDYCDNRVQQVYSPKQERVIEVIEPAPYTMMGLARRVGLSRQGLKEYKDKDEFSDAIKAARDRVQEDIETRLMEKSATGAIFNLKNNFGYVDKTEVDTNISGELKTGEANPEIAKQFEQFMKDQTRVDK